MPVNATLSENAQVCHDDAALCGCYDLAVEAGPGELGPSVSGWMVVAFLVFLPLLLVPMATLFLWSSFRMGRSKVFADNRSGPVVWPLDRADLRADERMIFVEPIRDAGSTGAVPPPSGARSGARRTRAIRRSRTSRNR